MTHCICQYKKDTPTGEVPYRGVFISKSSGHMGKKLEPVRGVGVWAVWEDKTFEGGLKYIDIR